MADKRDIKTVVVIGAGIMGRGIAHVAAAGGFNTILNDISDDLLQKALNRINEDLKKGVELGKVSASDLAATLDRLRLESDLSRATKDADIVIEAAPEKIDL